jgi:hypothetical protein
LFGCRGIEECKPAADDVPKAIALESVDTATPLMADAHQARCFEDVEVAGGGWPAMGEALREIAGRQLTPEVRQKLHDVATHLVR